MTGLREPRWWEAGFLDAVRQGESMAGAARIMKIDRTTPNTHAKRDARFAGELELARSTPRNGVRAPHGSQRNIAGKLAIFIARLAESSHVGAAAAEAGLTTATIYRLRREDADFARSWFAALAEGYDNLEMELLGQLRAGNGVSDGAKEAPKLDTAAALRCLSAHRDSVAREKGRRALADEVTTIASINAKIDRLRLNGEAGAKAIAKARRAKTARIRKGTSNVG